MAKKKSGKLYSRLSYTVFIDYDNKKMAIPPYANGLKILDVSRCSNLPLGIQCVKDK